MTEGLSDSQEDWFVVGMLCFLPMLFFAALTMGFFFSNNKDKCIVAFFITMNFMVFFLYGICLDTFQRSYTTMRKHIKDWWAEGWER